MSNYLAHRKTLLTSALVNVEQRIAALGGDSLASPDLLELRTAIQNEQAQFATASVHEVSDLAFELTLIEWLRGFIPADGPAGLIRVLNSDPVLKALERPTSFDFAKAGAVFSIRDSHQLTMEDVAAIRIAAASDDAMDELVGASMNLRMNLSPPMRPYLYRDVAVLLPLRLETLFDETPTGWRIRLRVMPDEASIRRDPAPATVFEIESLCKMWQSIYDALSPADRGMSLGTWLLTKEASHPWTVFSSRVLPSRAAWLATQHPPNLLGDVIMITPPTKDLPSPPNRVGGFPSHLEIWAAFGPNGAPEKIDEFDVSTSELLFDVIGARRHSGGSLVEERDRWWVSWTSAKQVGMGREILLTNHRGPADIRVLYAIGIGDENPQEHFRARIEAGDMAMLPLGAPTNAVDGEQAASLGTDPLEWLTVTARRLLNQEHGTVADPLLSGSLAGLGAKLPAMPTEGDPSDIAEILVGALWPPLWGHQMRNIWGCVDEADRLASWAARYLRPEGPLPSVRILEQPYGLLPVAAYTQWQPEGEEGDLALFEKRLQKPLLNFRAHWAKIARLKGTSVGAKTSELLDLIARDALSSGFGYRVFLPIELLVNLLGTVGAFDVTRFEEFVDKTFKPLYHVLGRDPAQTPGIRQMLAVGDYAKLEIPLVVPTKWPVWFYEGMMEGHPRLDEHGNPVPDMSPEQGFVRLLDILLRGGHNRNFVAQELRNLIPDSLLFRLLLHSCLLSSAAVSQANDGPTAPLLEPLVANDTQDTLLDQLSQTYSPTSSHDHPAGRVRHIVVEAIKRLSKVLQSGPPRAFAQIERALRATLDTAMHRIDPWLTGFASRRLEFLRARPETRFRLGVYGWLDGPIIGQPGPTSAGLLHAPSHAQAITSVVLRDAFISEGLESSAPGARNLWSMQLDSRRIRMATELADEVRLGSHVFEALGRRVEHIVAEAFADTMTAPIDVLRKAFPLREGQPDRGVTCHGSNSLIFFLDATPPPSMLSATDQNALLAIRAALGAKEQESFSLLRQSLDTYGDLLVSEAVHQVVQRRSDVAGAAMDAAAGLATPPNLSFVETPIEAENVATAVFIAIPFHPPPTDLTASPARIAENSVPAMLESQFGPAEQWRWEAQINGEMRGISLADIGLEPIDSLMLAPGLLESLFRHRLGVTDDVRLSGSGPLFLRRSLAMLRVLGKQPLLLSDVVAYSDTPDETASIRTIDHDAWSELQARYTVLRNAAQAMIDELDAARISDNGARIEKALFRVLRWGVMPTVTHEEQGALFTALFDHVSPDDSQLLPRLVENARLALVQRLKSTPSVDSTEPIGRAIAQLAAPEAQLAILSKLPTAMLSGKSRLVTATEDARLDEDWLSINAAVRSPLARLEALQLESNIDVVGPVLASLHTWSNAPDDHWLTGALATIEAQRETANGRDPSLRLPRFVAAYTSENLWSHDMIAAGLVDNWTESVPRTRQTTTAAFGFNAPAARPPQAILIAVPPTLDAAFGAQLDVPALVQVLEETRELTHARAANAEELDAYLAVVPTTTLHASGESGIRLEP